jgi:hypothetical protein
MIRDNKPVLRIGNADHAALTLAFAAFLQGCDIASCALIQRRHTKIFEHRGSAGVQRAARARSAREVVVRFTTLAGGAAFTALLVCQCASADPSGAALMPAEWTTRQLDFTYQQGFTTKYSCDGLRDRVKEILIKLGARDVQVRSMGCINPAGPDVFPGVHIQMNVLEPAHEWVIGRTVPASWKKVDLLADRDVVNAAADCELIEQVKQKVLPLFATRAIDYSAVCEKKKVLPGGTRLIADVLVPDQSVPTAAAH